MHMYMYVYVHICKCIHLKQTLTIYHELMTGLVSTTVSKPCQIDNYPPYCIKYPNFFRLLTIDICMMVFKCFATFLHSPAMYLMRMIELFYNEGFLVISKDCVPYKHIIYF